jgi:hypothetical protein
MEFDDIDTTFAALAFTDKRLRLAKLGSEIHLRNAALVPSLAQFAKEDLVTG